MNHSYIIDSTPSELKSGVKECSKFYDCLNERENKYEYSLHWYSNPNLILKSTQKQLIKLQNEISSLKEDLKNNKGFIMLTAKRETPNFNITQIPITIDHFKHFSTPSFVENLEKEIKLMDEKFEYLYKETGVREFIEKKITLKENKDSIYSLNFILSTYKKILLSKNDIFITIRYEPSEGGESPFFFNYVQLPASKFINYLKTNNIVEDILTKIKK